MRRKSAERMFSGPELVYHPLNRIFGWIYRYLPEKLRISMITIIWSLEGGQLRSGTARMLLAKYHEVRVGAFSYGSLLVPGMAQAGTTIGRYVSIGPNVRRYNTHHPIDSLSLHPYWYNPILRFVQAPADMPRTPIYIADDAWIGANVVILPGCKRIGVGAVVGAGAIVTHDVDDFSIVTGMPARERGKRLSPETRRNLLVANPWQFPPTECYQVMGSLSAPRK